MKLNNINVSIIDEKGKAKMLSNRARSSKRRVKFVNPEN
jgi:hypothetical protein